MFVLIARETGLAKTTPNLIQNMDHVYRLTKPTIVLSFSHSHITPLMQGWFVPNSPKMAQLLVPCFSETQMNEPCLLGVIKKTKKPIKLRKLGKKITEKIKP